MNTREITTDREWANVEIIGHDVALMGAMCLRVYRPGVAAA